MTIHILKNKQDKVALSEFDCVLLAIGRVPNTDSLGIDGLVSKQQHTQHPYAMKILLSNRCVGASI